MAAFHAPTLASETVAHIGSFPIRNSLIMGWIAVLVWVVLALIFRKKGGKLIPRGFQNVIEFIVEGLFNFFDSITQNRKETKRFFPVVATIFLFVITANWMGIMPGVGSIGFYEEHNAEPVAQEEVVEGAPVVDDHAAVPVVDDHADEVDPLKEASADDHAEGPTLVWIPLFRSAYADVNMTLALAIISIVMTQVYGIWGLGFFHYAGKFFINPFRDPIGSFVGILEIVAEFAKMISFTFRLFGNIFAGEMLLVVISFLSPYLAPIPFYGLEIFVGFIQALVFSLLTLVFMKMAVSAHGEEAHA